MCVSARVLTLSSRWGLVSFSGGGGEVSFSMYIPPISSSHSLAHSWVMFVLVARIPVVLQMCVSLNRFIMYKISVAWVYQILAGTCEIRKLHDSFMLMRPLNCSPSFSVIPPLFPLLLALSILEMILVLRNKFVANKLQSLALNDLTS